MATAVAGWNQEHVQPAPGYSQCDREAPAMMNYPLSAVSMIPLTFGHYLESWQLHLRGH